MNTHHTAARQGRTSRTSGRCSARALRLSTLMLSLLSAFAPTQHAHALPTGEQVVAGSVDFARPDSAVLNINQGSQRAIVNWQSFGSAAGEAINIVQPGRDAVLLNRVVGNDPSHLFGALKANGSVYLINPAGVYFAPGSQVHVGSLVTSTLGMSDADFLAGRSTFARDGAAAGIRNQGDIRADEGGIVAFFAPQIDNAGHISAPGGSVALAAGDRVTLSLSPRGLVNVSVDGATLDAHVSHSGHIEADGGTVLLSARSAGAVMDTVLNVSGVVRARSAVERNGVIVLEGAGSGVVNLAGTLDASGEGTRDTGGTVKVLGERVALAASATIDVTGDAGGGTALVGGNWQGGGSERNALATFVAEGARIDASARDQGDGGTVVVWADEATRYRGSIAARGGERGGDGGQVEVSGKQYLAFEGQVDTRAPNGEVGNLLLDPESLIITTTVTTTPEFTDESDSNGINDDDDNVIFENDTSNPLTSTLKKSDLVDLGNNTNVTLTATKDITFQSSGTADDRSVDLGTKTLAIKTDQLNLNGWSIKKAEVDITAGKVSGGGATIIGNLTFNGSTEQSGEIEVTESTTLKATQANQSATLKGNFVKTVKLEKAGVNNSGSWKDVTVDNTVEKLDKTLDFKKLTIEGDATTLTTISGDLEFGGGTYNTINSSVAGVVDQAGALKVTTLNLTAITGGRNATLDHENNISSVELKSVNSGSWKTIDLKNGTNDLKIKGNATTLKTTSGELEFGGGAYTTIDSTVSGDVKQTGALTVTTLNLTATTGGRNATLGDGNNLSSVELKSVNTGSWDIIELTNGTNDLKIKGNATTLETTSGELKFGGGTYDTIDSTVSGDVKQTGALAATTLNLTATTGGRNATLGDDNNLSSVELKSVNSGSWQTIDLKNGTNDLTIKGNATTLKTTSGELEFGGGTYDTIDSTVSGHVKQSGVLIVENAMTLTHDSTNSSFVLLDHNNDFNSVILAKGNEKLNWVEASISDINDLAIQGTILDNLTATLPGSLTQKGALAAKVLTVRHSALSNVELLLDDNDFTEVFFIDSSNGTQSAIGSVRVSDKNGFVFGENSTDPTLALVSTGDFVLKAKAGNIDLKRNVGSETGILLDAAGELLLPALLHSDGDIIVAASSAGASNKQVGYSVAAAGTVGMMGVPLDYRSVSSNAVAYSSTVNEFSWGAENSGMTVHVGSASVSGTEVKGITAPNATLAGYLIYSADPISVTGKLLLHADLVTLSSESNTFRELSVKSGEGTSEILVKNSGPLKFASVGNRLGSVVTVENTGDLTVVDSVATRASYVANGGSLLIDGPDTDIGNISASAVNGIDIKSGSYSSLSLTSREGAVSVGKESGKTVSVGSVNAEAKGNINISSLRTRDTLSLHRLNSTEGVVAVSAAGDIDIAGDVVSKLKGATGITGIALDSDGGKGGVTMSNRNAHLSAQKIEINANRIGDVASGGQARDILVNFTSGGSADRVERILYSAGSRKVYFGSQERSETAPVITSSLTVFNSDSTPPNDSNIVVWNDFEGGRVDGTIGATQSLANLSASELRGQVFGSRSLVTRIQNGQVLAEAVTVCAEGDASKCETTANALALGPLPPAIDDIADGGVGQGGFIALQPGDLQGLPESTASGTSEQDAAERPETEVR